MSAFDNPEELVQRFGWPDYLVFGLMLAVSAAIGIYYAFPCGKSKDSGASSTEEFLMGGRNMGTFPVSMSLIASFMSAITLLGTPAEMYQFGTMYWMIGISYFLVMPASAYLYLPIFYKLQVTSAYEYLERRFHRSVRMLGSATFTIQMSLYMAVVVYAPALALSQVTGIGVYVSVTSIFIVCIFYTAMGGLKAVMWTDAFQVLIMYGAMIAICIKGDYDVGGASEVIKRNYESGRIEFFEFNANPAVRHSFWSLVIGGYFQWATIYAVNQSQVQRYLSVPTIKQAQRAIWINLLGLLGLLCICCYTGLVIFAKYYNCDPLTAKLVERSEQLFPLFVMDTLGHLPVLPGLFVAGIFSGALSTVSSGLNSLAAIVMEDFVKPLCWSNMSDRVATNLSKGLAVVIGLVCFGLVFVAEQLGNALEAALSIFGMVGGPLLGVFTLGMFIPWANWIGAATGIISSLVFMFWIGFGSQGAKAQGLLVLRKKPFSIAGCPFLNFTEMQTQTPLSLTDFFAEQAALPSSELSWTIGDTLGLYKVSYMWYSTIGCFTVIVVGMIVSFLTGLDDPKKLNPDLMCPVHEIFGRFLPDRWKEFLRFGIGDDYVPPPTHVVDSKPMQQAEGYINSSFADDSGAVKSFGSKSYDVTKV